MRKLSKITLMTLVCMLSLLFMAPGLSIPASAATPPGEEGIAPQADVLQWIYTEIDGNTYKRLYNASTGCWVGDWILVKYKGEPGSGKHPTT